MLRSNVSVGLRFGLILGGAFLVGPMVPAQTAAGRFAIADVNLFDGDTVREHQTVVVDGGKIMAVGTKAAPAGVR
jgi:hypothetical protein